ncbi:alpha-amylase family glycosyl hydrolase [Bacillus carboniphilus]|uniref:Alpha-amylase family glycosyl hydrolase n=1 Tax=Bacillus carboniphilus TaxID=86663 RepID=A0ABY9JU52_9BACI|nr:alpha-amylase family glycosyl hydrolase [Bacillus carboniphilus]WLR42919.1 alpha-amylase family glycosyl hydrolase [Bacillus carboniphilus]
MFYYITVDRFNNGDMANDEGVNVEDPTSFHGGDLKGIIDKLDYISDMGFTSIVLSPIYDTDQYNGQSINNFQKIDVRFGTLDELQMLVQEAHDRDLKVVLTFVSDHTSSEHPWLEDEEKENWFLSEGEGSLPSLNLENKQLNNYLIATAKWWIEETNIDGFYLDSYEKTPSDYVKKLINEVQSIKDPFLFIADSKSETRVEGIYASGNAKFHEEVSEAFKKTDQQLYDFSDIFSEESSLSSIHYLDRYDTVRFTRKAVDGNYHPGTRLMLALTYMYTTPGIPMVYYGTEVALDGGDPPDNQRLMNFFGDDEVITHIEKLSNIRSSLPALSEGEFELLYNENGMTIFKRTLKDETVFIAINNTSKDQVVDLSSDVIEEEKQLQGLLEDDIIKVNNGKLPVSLERETAEIYEVVDEVGINISFILVIISVPVLFILFLFVVKRRSLKNEE